MAAHTSHTGDTPKAERPPEVGDTVRTIYPGSPEMLVTDVNGDDVHCHWHDGFGTLREQRYHAAALRVAGQAHHAGPVLKSHDRGGFSAQTRTPHGESHTSGPASLTGEGEKADAVITEEGKAAAKATHAAESARHGTHPKTPGK